MNQKYTPNFSDARVRRRCIKALGFVESHFSDKPRKIGTRYIDRYLGIQSNDLSGFLRKCLLENTNPNWNKKKKGYCKQYRVNTWGIRYLYTQLGDITTDISKHLKEKKQNTRSEKSSYDIARDHDCVWYFLDQEYQRELREGLKYQDKSDRLWHDLQNVKNIYKRPWLASQGVCHQYDIDTAAPRLLLQRAQSVGMDLYLETLEDYIQHKHYHRQRLSQDLGISESQVKILINALLAGARLGSGKYFALGRLLDNDPEVISRVKNNIWIQALRSDIKTLWQYIHEDIGITKIRTRVGQIRRLPLNSRQKWQIYFQEERRCLEEIRKYLDQHHMTYLLEHDGWTSDQACDIRDLQTHIQNQCGRYLTFKYELISDQRPGAATHHQ